MGANDQVAPPPQQEKWWLWALLAVTLLGGVLRFSALSAKTLWLDEAFSLWMARHELPALFEWLIYIDHHPPLFYILLHAWIEWLGDSPGALRSLSAVTSTLAIPLYGWSTRRLGGAGVGIIATLLLAISPFHIRYAQEVRMYGALTLAAALLFVALAYLVTARDGSLRRGWWAWALLALAEAALMLTHNTATILTPPALNAAIFGLWLAKRRGWGSNQLPGLSQPSFLCTWIISQIGALLLWSPWAMAFVRQAQVVDGDFWIAPPNLWTIWLALGSLSFAYLPKWLPLHDYLTWLAVGLALWGTWQWQRSALLSWLLMALFLIPPAIALLASLRRPIFYDRTLIWTTLPYFLLVARGIVFPRRFGSRLRVSWFVVMFTFMAILCGLGIWNYYTDFEKEDWDKAALFVAEDALPQELILFHASWAELPFDYYYPESAPPLTQHGVPVDLFDAGALEPPMTEGDVPRLLTLIEGEETLWLVYSHWWYTDSEGLLLRVLEEQLEVVDQWGGPGIRVIHYRRR